MTELITILGPTASGKTALAVALADKLGTEIISADSRQLYRRMDIGTGKDLSEYEIEGRLVPHHLIDICEPGYRYNLYEYRRDFGQAYESISLKGKIPILCGGTGLYIETVLKGYHLPPVPENKVLRDSLQSKTLAELSDILKGYKQLHNTTDTDTCKRAIRAIEIEEFYKNQLPEERIDQPLESLIIGVDLDRDLRREKISRRLKARLNEGMIEEVRGLIDSGVEPENLIYYGLEYKFLTEYVIGRISYSEMVSGLEIAIHQFAKRQMTWFRGMERRGFRIHWLDALLPMEEKISRICWLMDNK